MIQGVGLMNAFKPPRHSSDDGARHHSQAQVPACVPRFTKAQKAKAPWFLSAVLGSRKRNATRSECEDLFPNRPDGQLRVNVGYKTGFE